MIWFALYVFQVQLARRIFAAAAAGALVFLLTSTAPHWVHHVGEAAHHQPVACQAYMIAVGVQWLTLVAAPAFVFWVVHCLLAAHHEYAPDFGVRPLPRGRAPPSYPR